MIDWLKNIKKEYPDFWKNYLKSFDQKSNKYVAFTLETTGLDCDEDVILSIGAIAIDNNQIAVGSSFEIAISQHHFFNKKGMMEQPANMELYKMEEHQAIEAFVTFIENATLVGHRVDFDIEIINVALEKMGCGSLKNEAFDTEVMHKKLADIDDKDFAINQLTSIYKIPTPVHQSVATDSFVLSILFLKLKQKLGLK